MYVLLYNLCVMLSNAMEPVLGDLTLLVARNLKRIREEKKLSLDRLAELTGVSKSMLGQIERGDSSPTIATVWKISNGLKVSFTALLDEPQPDTFVIRQADIHPLTEDGGKYRLFPLFPVADGRPFEAYLVEIDPGGQLNAEAHPAGTQEFLSVFQGELTLRVAEQDYCVSEGSTIRFRADRPHAYANHGSGLAKMHLTIHYA
jgi:XRE family transcriptional regulator, regulator of sulfur utilization